MTITFQCEHCGKEVKAPDSAAGKRGKCPFCQQSNYIPAPVSQDEILPLAPLDEQAERQRQEEIRALMEQEREVISQTGGGPPVPLEQRKDLAAEDLYHLVVNYCLDLVDSKLDRSETHLGQLKKFPSLALQAVEAFLSGKTIEPALDHIPPRVLKGFLTQLRDQLKKA